jgi:hypothetical protein
VLRRIIALTLSAAVVVGVTPSALAQFERPSSSQVPAGSTYITIDEAEFSHSIRKGLTLGPGGRYDESFHCITFQEDRDECSVETPGMQFSAFNVLPVCKTVEQLNCLVGVRFTEGGNPQTGEFVREIDGQTYPAVPELDIHEGGSASIWTVPGSPHSAGTTEYTVMVFERQDYDPRLGRFFTGQVTLSVVPFSIKPSNASAREVFEGLDANGKNQVYEFGPGEDCVWHEAGVCAKRADFIGTPEISVTVRYSKDVSGWFRGRVSDTTAEVSEFRNANYEVTVSGKPVSVPRFGVLANQENTNQAVREIFAPGSGGSGELFQQGSYKGAFATDGWFERPYRVLEAYRDVVKDSAAGISTIWSIESFSIGRGEPCFQGKDGLLGIVSTNATVYDGLEPEFESGQLTYKVAGLHYGPDGQTLNLGTYDLVMRSDVARCLYGFSNAPVSAQVQVVNEAGEEVVATTVVSERDGWLKLAAYGFTFSEKEIQVKITQPQIRTLTNFNGRVTSLSTKQKAQIRAAVTKGAGNPKFICTGIRFVSQPARDNIIVRARAKAACEYAKSLNPKLSTFFQTKTTQARSYNGRVLVVSK